MIRTVVGSELAVELNLVSTWGLDMLQISVMIYNVSYPGKNIPRTSFLQAHVFLLSHILC
jgi:hypothetical protein